METALPVEKLVNSWYDVDTETSAAVTAEEQEETEERRGGTLFRIYLNDKLLEDHVFFSSCRESFLSVVGDCCGSAKILWGRECRKVRDRYFENRR